MSDSSYMGTEAEAEVRVSISGADGDTPNLFVWNKDKLIAKIWLYPDGKITYRSFVPKTTVELLLRNTSIMHSYHINRDGDKSLDDAKDDL